METLAMSSSDATAAALERVLADSDGPILLAGAGRMGGALLAGWLESGLDPARVVVQDPSPSPFARELAEKFGVVVEAASTAGPFAVTPVALVVAVKPQVIDAVWPALAARASPATLTLSIAAGWPIAGFAAHLPPGAGIVRAMPNTPAAIGRGISAMVASSTTTPAQRSLAASARWSNWPTRR
jgi:pyrroline-5-carboxylate reductase